MSPNDGQGMPGTPEPPGGWIPLGPSEAPPPGRPGWTPPPPPARRPAGPPPQAPNPQQPNPQQPYPQQPAAPQQPAQQQPPPGWPTAPQAPAGAPPQRPTGPAEPFPPFPGLPAQGAAPDPNQPPSGWSGAAPTPTGPSSSGGSGSNMLWPVLCLVLAVVAVGAVLVALNNSSSGNRWKSQYSSADALSRKLDSQLSATDASTKKLEARIVKLANEKAQAEDRQAVKVTFPSYVGATADLLDQCASQTRDLLNAVGNAQSESDIVGLENQANQVFQVCTKAQAGADQLVAYLRAQEK